MSRELLVIDNYDSFTYNLVQEMGALGAEPVVFRNDAIDVKAIRQMAPEGIVISPGPCTPAEAGISTDLVRELGPTTPILGVCLGHQCIGEAYGGRVVRAPRVMHGKLSQVNHDGTGVLAGLPSPLTATRYHSLVVEEPLPPGLIATAWAEDVLPGGARTRVLMAMRHVEHPVEGVQFHPESIMTDTGHQLLRNFIELCEKHAAVAA